MKTYHVEIFKESGWQRYGEPAMQLNHARAFAAELRRMYPVRIVEVCATKRVIE